MLDADGQRIAARYYAPHELPSLREQHALEQSLHAKTRGAYAEIVMLDRTVAVYRALGDATLYVLGTHEHNELVLQSALDTMCEALETLLRGQVSKRSLLENYDFLMLVLDETIDRGVLLETDAALVVTRVSMSDRPAKLTPLHEQTLSQIVETAKSEIVRSLKQ